MAAADCHLTLRAGTGVQFSRTRSSLQFRQAQFHCGNPPPAASWEYLLSSFVENSLA